MGTEEQASGFWGTLGGAQGPVRLARAAVCFSTQDQPRGFQQTA